MSHFPQQSPRQAPFGLSHADAGNEQITLARFFNVVYAWMAVGLAVTAVVGWLVAHSSLINVVYANRGIYFAIGLAAFGLAWYVQSQVGRMSAGTATVLFMVYAVVIGALISGIFTRCRP